MNRSKNELSDFNGFEEIEVSCVVIQNDLLRSDSHVLKERAKLVLTKVKMKCRGKYFRYEKICDKPLTFKMVRCNKGDAGAFFI